MNEIDDILDGHEYFTCERFNARLRKDICIERQEGNHSVIDMFKNSTVGLSFEACKTCRQGKQIRDELLKDKPKPRRGTGNRKEECAFYDDCLDRAAKKDWKTFNCEGCSYFKPEPERVLKVTEKTENTRVCETDGCENITIQPSSPYCSKCMAKKSSDARKRKKENTRYCETPGCNNPTNHPNFPHCPACTSKRGRENKKNKNYQKCKSEGCENKAQKNGYCKPCNVKFGNHKTDPNKGSRAPDIETEGISRLTPILDKDNVICVDFEGYESVLKQVKILAQEDVRPLNFQVVWMLKKFLNDRVSINE